MVVHAQVTATRRAVRGRRHPDVVTRDAALGDMDLCEIASTRVTTRSGGTTGLGHQVVDHQPAFRMRIEVAREAIGVVG